MKCKVCGAYMDAGAQFCNSCGAKDVPGAWKCAGCETLNTGEVCIVCGLSKPVEMPETEKEESIHKTEESVTAVTADNPEKKKNKKPLVAVAAIVVIVAGWLLAVEMGIIPPINIELNF